MQLQVKDVYDDLYYVSEVTHVVVRFEKHHENLLRFHLVVFVQNKINDSGHYDRYYKCEENSDIDGEETIEGEQSLRVIVIEW